MSLGIISPLHSGHFLFFSKIIITLLYFFLIWDFIQSGVSNKDKTKPDFPRDVKEYRAFLTAIINKAKDDENDFSFGMLNAITDGQIVFGLLGIDDKASYISDRAIVIFRYEKRGHEQEQDDTTQETTQEQEQEDTPPKNDQDTVHEIPQQQKQDDMPQESGQEQEQDETAQKTDQVEKKTGTETTHKKTRPGKTKK